MHFGNNLVALMLLYSAVVALWSKPDDQQSSDCPSAQSFFKSWVGYFVFSTHHPHWIYCVNGNRHGQGTNQLPAVSQVVEKSIKRSEG